MYIKILYILICDVLQRNVTESVLLKFLQYEYCFICMFALIDDKPFFFYDLLKNLKFYSRRNLRIFRYRRIGLTFNK